MPWSSGAAAGPGIRWLSSRRPLLTQQASVTHGPTSTVFLAGLCPAASFHQRKEGVSPDSAYSVRLMPVWDRCCAFWLAGLLTLSCCVHSSQLLFLPLLEMPVLSGLSWTRLVPNSNSFELSYIGGEVSFWKANVQVLVVPVKSPLHCSLSYSSCCQGCQGMRCWGCSLLPPPISISVGRYPPVPAKKSLGKLFFLSTYFNACQACRGISLKVQASSCHVFLTQTSHKVIWEGSHGFLGRSISTLGRFPVCSHLWPVLLHIKACIAVSTACAF